MISKVAIIGMGLIGGSIGMALTYSGTVEQVTGIDQDSHALQLAMETGAVHTATQDLVAGLSQADVVFLALPVSTIINLGSTIGPLLQPGSVVTDVGSVKQVVVQHMERILPPGISYVGGHPMAGSERVGIQAADRYLLENAAYVLTPTSRTDQRALQVVSHLVQVMGARPIILDPVQHDEMVAAVSHLPHLVATALVQTAAFLDSKCPGTLTLAAGGFRDATRIAGANPVMWRDICLANRGQLLKVMQHFRATLTELEALITDGRGDELMEVFHHACQVRAQIPAKAKGLLPPLAEVVVTVPDRPGMIGHLAQVLGNGGINITDIEILRVREGEGGTIRLGFLTDQSADMAVGLLRASGVVAKRR